MYHGSDTHDKNNGDHSINYHQKEKQHIDQYQDPYEKCQDQYQHDQTVMVPCASVKVRTRRSKHRTKQQEHINDDNKVDKRYVNKSQPPKEYDDSNIQFNGQQAQQQTQTQTEPHTPSQDKVEHSVAKSILVPQDVWSNLNGNEFITSLKNVNTLAKTSLRFVRGIACRCGSENGSENGSSSRGLLNVWREEEEAYKDSKNSNNSPYNNNDKNNKDNMIHIEWKADKRTRRLINAEFDSQDDVSSDDVDDSDEMSSSSETTSTSTSTALRHALENEGEVLVWKGRFRYTNPNSNSDQNEEYYGMEIPLVRTHSIIPMSPYHLSKLLMDSSKVRTYNKMSLGRTDLVFVDKGGNDDDELSSDESGGWEGKGGGDMDGGLDGEAKIVRNLTNPPMSKRNMELITFMHARRLRYNDNVGPGILGGDNVGEESNGVDGWVVVSRAVSGGKWGTVDANQANNNINNNNNNNSNNKNTGNDNEDNDNDKPIRSEILIGINLMRSVPNNPNQTELTSITHVRSPSVPIMLAGKIGVKGAVDFIRDIRSVSELSE